MSTDDAIALTGLAFLLVGVYLWLGLAAAFILLGLVMIYIGMRVEFPERRSRLPRVQRGGMELKRGPD